MLATAVVGVSIAGIVLLACTFSRAADLGRLEDEQAFNRLVRKIRSSPGVGRLVQVGGTSPPKTKTKEKSRMVIAENICPSVLEWRNLSTALTVDGAEVNIVQGMFGWAHQWFYTVQCSPKVENRTCQWIDEKEAPRTACITSYNLVPAIVEVNGLDDNGQEYSSFDWRMIRLPGRCGCFRLRAAISSPSAASPFATKLSAF